MNGIEVARQISSLLPETKLVLVTERLEMSCFREAFAAGASGYVPSIRQHPAGARPDARGKRETFVPALYDSISSLTDPDEIVRTAATLLADHLQVDRCVYWISEADEDCCTLISLPPTRKSPS